MARLAPSLVAYCPDDFPIPSEIRTDIARRLNTAFDDADFEAISTALAFAVEVWRSRKEMPQQQAVLAHIQDIRECTASLKALLTSTGNAAEFGVNYIRFVGDGDPEESDSDDILDETWVELFSHSDDVVQHSIRALDVLALSSEIAEHQVAARDTLNSGADSTHFDRLLEELGPIAARRGLRTSITTDPVTGFQSSQLVDLVCCLQPLMPPEMKFSHPAVMKRLRLIRRAARQRVCK